MHYIILTLPYVILVTKYTESALVMCMAIFPDVY